MNTNLTDRLSHAIVLVAFSLAAIALMVAPFLALSWSKNPFPGFVVEQTLVVANYGGANWPGHREGIKHPQRVTQLGDQLVFESADFRAAIASLAPEATLQVHTILPDGTEQTFTTPLLERFPLRDVVRLFWLPYGIGLAYLGIGIWVYRIKGPTRSCRAFAFLSTSVALVNILVFDLISTHRTPVLWTLAVAVLGSALISISFLFPAEWAFVQRWPWLRLIPYAITIVLARRSLVVLFDNSAPWDYIDAWRESYIYAAIGIAFFLITMIMRLRFRASAVVRRQAQVILLGSFLAFVPQAVWFITPMFGMEISYNPLFFMPLLLLFPVAITIALLRYRLWNVEVIIRRTLIYSLLSLLLAVGYISCVVVLQILVSARTATSLPSLFTQASIVGGEKPTAMMTAISTLFLAALIAPLRVRVQDFIDRRFYRKKYDAERSLAQFAATARDEVEMNKLTAAMLNVVQETMQPEKLSLWLVTNQDHAKTIKE